jgi:hypothetical protein
MRDSAAYIEFSSDINGATKVSEKKMLVERELYFNYTEKRLYNSTSTLFPASILHEIN